MNRYIFVILLIVSMIGFSVSAFSQDYGPSYDVDKYTTRGVAMPSDSISSTDRNACWMASTSNILMYTGWVAAQHGNDVQDVYDTFLRHFDGNETGTLDKALRYYIPTHSQSMSDSEFNTWWTTNVAGFVSMEDLQQKLRNGYGVHLSISAFGGHVISPWQIELNGDGTGSILATDSQDGVKQERWYDLRLDEGTWYLDGYTLDSARIGNIQIQGQYTFAVRQNPLLNDPYPIGRYADGRRDIPISYAFVQAYLVNGGQSKLGVPDSSPGETPYMHTWGPLLIQDFTGGEYGDLAIIYNPEHNMAYVVRSGFWNAFKNLDGYCRDYFLRRPTSDEYKPKPGQAEGGNKVIAIQDFEFGHMEFYVDGCSNPGGCVDMYSNTIDETVGYSDDVKPPSLHCPMLLTESMSSYRPESYTVTAQIRKDLLALRDGSLFELAWSMECGNDLIRLAGIYSDNDWGWQFSYDASDDGAGGNEAFETYRLGTTFDAEYMYVELTTNYPIQGVMSEYGLGLLSPGDLYINVGGSLLENTGTLFGLALTSHSGDMTGNADPYDDIYTWDAVQQGHLYKDVTFATGTFEEYAGADTWFEDGGDDPFGRANNIPTLIAQWGQDLGYQGDVSWEKPVPEPSTLLLLGSGLIGMLSLVRKKFKK